MMEMVTPHLKSVLKNYQHSATKSLQGPGLSLVQPKREITSPEVKEECGANDSTSSYGNNLQPPPPPASAARFPVLTAPDTGRSERTETILEGVSISCFVVGGEKRLCLPQVLNSVLHEFTLPQINQECDQLQIFCSRCTPEQLNELKSNGILPSTAPSCGLITKTDAERLCSALLHCNAPVLTGPRSSHLHKDALSFRVYHECFGKCKGSCLPDLFTARDARCIECLECQGLYSPQQFVCHVHRDLENRTCHWGFDSTNWRAYLKIAKDQLDKEKMEGVLDVMREQYDGTTPFPPAASNNHKRKQIHHLDIDPLRGEVLDSLKQDLLDIPPKKLKLEEFAKSKLDDYTKSKLDDYAKSKQDEYSKSKLGNYAAYIYAASMSPLYINAALQWSNHHQLPPCYPLPSLKDGYQHGLMKDGYQAAIPKELLHPPIKQEAGVHQTIKQENTHIKENHNASYIKDNLQIHQDSDQQHHHHHHHNTILRESSSQIRQNSTDKFIGQSPHNHHSNILHQKKYRHKMSPVDESRTGDDKDYERRTAAMDIKETVITQPANMTEKSSVSVVQSTEVSVIAREPYPVLMSHNEIYNPNNAHVDIRNNRSVITESNVSLNHQPSTSGVQNKLGYNPEIELSTDTDDSFSDASGETAKKEMLESNKSVQQINAVEKPTHRPVISETPVTSSNKNYNHQNIYLMQIEKLLLSTNEDVKTEVLNIAKFLASENSRLEILSRQKDDIISSQQERISKLESQINVNSEESVVSASPDQPRCNGLSVVSPDRESSQERVTSSNGDMVQETGSPKPVESDSPVPVSKPGSPPATLATAKNDEAIMIKIEPE